MAIGHKQLNANIISARLLMTFRAAKTVFMMKTACLAL